MNILCCLMSHVILHYGEQVACNKGKLDYLVFVKLKCVHVFIMGTLHLKYPHC